MQDLLDRLKARADASEAFIKEYDLANFNQIRDAAVKFVLSNPDMNSACLTIKNFDDLEFYVGLSGRRFTPADEAKLAVYSQAMGQYYCRHACGECESQCPHGVPVNTIMRYNHYFKGQGREKTAMVKYAALPTQKADRCRDCSGRCEKACPHGVPIQGMLTLAHQTLTLV
jgi:predicted aldo/keto reductase-like oxidoreductase